MKQWEEQLQELDHWITHTSFLVQQSTKFCKVGNNINESHSAIES